MSIKRGSNGYGFTLTGNRPCRVSRVNCGKSKDGVMIDSNVLIVDIHIKQFFSECGAYISGLHSGDRVMCINSRSVDNLSAYVVAAIIK